MKIPTYWFCFVLSAGVIALLPIWHFRVGRRPEKSLNILATAYDHGAFDENWRFWTFVCHVVGATLVAIIATTLIQNCSKDDKTESQTSIKYWLCLTTLIAMYFAILNLIKLPMNYVAIAVIPIIGYGVSSGIIGWMESRGRKHSRQNAG